MERECAEHFHSLDTVQYSCLLPLLLWFSEWGDRGHPYSREQAGRSPRDARSRQVPCTFSFSPCHHSILKQSPVAFLSLLHPHSSFLNHVLIHQLMAIHLFDIGKVCVKKKEKKKKTNKYYFTPAMLVLQWAQPPLCAALGPRALLRTPTAPAPPQLPSPGWPRAAALQPLPLPQVQSLELLLLVLLLVLVLVRGHMGRGLQGIQPRGAKWGSQWDS